MTPKNNLTMTHYRTLFFAVTLLFVMVSIQFAREWTATNGHKLAGEFVKLEREVVHLSLSDGKTAEVKLEQLCEADQKFVREQHEQKQSPFLIRENIATSSNKEEVSAGAEKKFDHNTPLDVLLTEAEKGNLDSLGWLCVNYMYGLNGCKVDKIKAEEYCVKSSKFANTGSAVSQFCTGMLLLNNKDNDVARNAADGVEWFRKSAGQGFAPAQERLALCFAKGVGVKEDRNAAFEWFQKSASQGFAPAEFGLAIFYNDGIATEKSDIETTKWLRKSAEHGFAPAQELYAWFLFQGIGVQKDEDEAMEWYRKAVEQDDQEAVAKPKQHTDLPVIEIIPGDGRKPTVQTSAVKVNQNQEREESANAESPVFVDRPSSPPQRQNRNSRQRNAGDVGRAVGTGLQIYNTIRAFSQ